MLILKVFLGNKAANNKKLIQINKISTNFLL